MNCMHKLCWRGCTGYKRVHWRRHDQEGLVTCYRETPEAEVKGRGNARVKIGHVLL